MGFRLVVDLVNKVGFVKSFVSAGILFGRSSICLTRASHQGVSPAEIALVEAGVSKPARLPDCPNGGQIVSSGHATAGCVEVTTRNVDEAFHAGTTNVSSVNIRFKPVADRAGAPSIWLSSFLWAKQLL